MNLLKSLQIDPHQLKTLIIVYLKQDIRSSKSVLRQGKSEMLTSNRAVVTVVFFYVLTGFVIGISIFTISDIFFYSTLAASFTLMLVALAIVAESGNVIFNESEADVIGHLPVTSRTLFAAKALNLFLFALLLATAVNLIPILFGVFAAGMGPLFIISHALCVFLVSAFAAALVISSYGLLIRYVDKERFNNIIAYAQTGLALFFIIGYQLLPRLLQRYEEGINSLDRRYFLLYPPAWFAGVSMLALGKFERLFFALATLAVLSVLLLVTVALKKIATGYASFVTRMAHDSGGNLKPVKTERQPGAIQSPESPIRARLKALLLPTSAERAVFDLVSSYMKRSREIKVRLYPSFAYFIMFPLFSLFTGGIADPFMSRHFLEGNQQFLFYSLMGCAMIPFVTLSGIEVMLFSEHYRAAYIFHVAPIASLSLLHRGLRKAMLCYLALPGAIVLFIIYSILWRNPFHALLIVLPWIILAPAMIMVSFIRREMLPLSHKYQKGQQSARSMFLFLGNFVFLIFIGVLQTLAIKQIYPYWLFLFGTLIFSLLLYFFLRLLSGEIRPLLPDSQSFWAADASE